MDLIFNEKLAVHAKMMFKASVSTVGESVRMERSPRATSLDLCKISWYCPSLFKCSFLSVSIHCVGTGLCPSVRNSCSSFPATICAARNFFHFNHSVVRGPMIPFFVGGGAWREGWLTSHETPPTVGQGLMEFFDRKNDPKTETKLESCQKHWQQNNPNKNTASSK